MRELLEQARSEDERVKELFESFLDENARFYEHLNRNPALGQYLRDLLFSRFQADTTATREPVAGGDE